MVIKKSKNIKRILSLLMLFVFMFSVAAPAAFAEGVNYSTDSKVNQGIWKIVNMVGGIGGAVFTLMFLVITVVIAFKSVNPQHAGMLWTGLITCAVAGVIFFSAYFLTNDLKGVLS